MKKSWKIIKEKIDKYDNITIFHHVNPDGDCMGSQFGLKKIIELNFKNKDVRVEKGMYSPLRTNFMKFKFSEPHKDGLAIIVDTPAAHRVDGDISHFDDVIVIDHHASPCDIKATLIAHTDRPATCQIIAEMAMENDLKMNKEAATCLFLGLVTDTDRFMLRSVSSKSFKVAAYLSEFDVDLDYIYRGIYTKLTKEIEIEQYILKEMNIDEGVASCYIPQSFINQVKVKRELFNKINMLGYIDEVECWVFFTDWEDNIRCEIRSTADYKCNEVAFKWGGGGHNQSSGCALKNETDIKLVIEDLKQLVKGNFKR